MTDYYADLGVSRNASVKDIKTAYRKLAMQCHPDRNKSPESLEKFKLITTAYEVLGNETKKAEYDLQSNKFHHADFNFYKNKQTWSNFKFNDFTEPTKPSKYRVTLTLEEAYKGDVVTVNGRLIRIPAGIKSHTTLYSDKSIIEVIVHPHNKFKRSENDLLVDTDLAIQDAILGVCVIITHIDETKLQFNVPAGTQTGQVIRLSGKGMYDIDNDCRGDLLIRCNVVIPTKLTEEQIKFFKSMQTCNPINI